MAFAGGGVGAPLSGKMDVGGGATVAVVAEIVLAAKKFHVGHLRWFMVHGGDRAQCNQVASSKLLD